MTTTPTANPNPALLDICAEAWDIWETADLERRRALVRAQEGGWSLRRIAEGLTERGFDIHHNGVAYLIRVEREREPQEVET